MKSAMRLLGHEVVFVAVLLFCVFFAATARAQDATWKTAFVKRGIVGNLDSTPRGAEIATYRMRVPLGFEGTAARVAMTGPYGLDTTIAKLSLAPGADDMGKIAGPVHVILFQGKPEVTVKTRENVLSDAMPMTVTRSTWYLQESFASPKMPYAYDVDSAFSDSGDKHDELTPSRSQRGQFLGPAVRIDVLTTDPRMAIICYGDSITHGYNSTPNAGKRYPDVLAKLVNRPTLNLGMNGDEVAESGRGTSVAKDILGADTVIMMIGINDIIGGSRIKTLEQYTKAATHALTQFRNMKLTICLGTIPPAGGYKRFDAEPAKEELRQQINAWIRSGAPADRVIDFDAALADPQSPGKMRAEYQSDWLHPNDLGYEAMAKAAAAVVQK